MNGIKQNPHQNHFVGGIKSTHRYNVCVNAHIKSISNVCNLVFVFKKKSNK